MLVVSNSESLIKCREPDDPSYATATTQPLWDLQASATASVTITMAQPLTSVILAPTAINNTLTHKPVATLVDKNNVPKKVPTVTFS